MTSNAKAIGEKIALYTNQNNDLLRQHKSRNNIKSMNIIDVANFMVKNGSLSKTEFETWINGSFTKEQVQQFKSGQSVWLAADFGKTQDYVDEMSPLSIGNMLGFERTTNEKTGKTETKSKAVSKQKFSVAEEMKKQSFMNYIKSLPTPEATYTELMRSIEFNKLDNKGKMEMMLKISGEKYNEAKNKGDKQAMKEHLLEGLGVAFQLACKKVDDATGISATKDFLYNRTIYHRLVELVDKLVDDGDDATLSDYEKNWEGIKGFAQAMADFVGAQGVVFAGGLELLSAGAAGLSSMTGMKAFSIGFNVLSKGFFMYQGGSMMVDGYQGFKNAETKEEAGQYGGEFGMGAVMFFGSAKSLFNDIQAYRASMSISDGQGGLPELSEGHKAILNENLPAIVDNAQVSTDLAFLQQNGVEIVKFSPETGFELNVNGNSHVVAVPKGTTMTFESGIADITSQIRNAINGLTKFSSEDIVPEPYLTDGRMIGGGIITEPLGKAYNAAADGIDKLSIKINQAKYPKEYALAEQLDNLKWRVRVNNDGSYEVTEPSGSIKGNIDASYTTSYEAVRAAVDDALAKIEFTNSELNSMGVTIENASPGSSIDFSFNGKQYSLTSQKHVSSTSTDGLKIELLKYINGEPSELGGIMLKTPIKGKQNAFTLTKTNNPFANSKPSIEGKNKASLPSKSKVTADAQNLTRQAEPVKVENTGATENTATLSQIGDGDLPTTPEGMTQAIIDAKDWDSLRALNKGMKKMPKEVKELYIQRENQLRTELSPEARGVVNGTGITAGGVGIRNGLRGSSIPFSSSHRGDSEFSFWDEISGRADRVRREAREREERSRWADAMMEEHRAAREAAEERNLAREIRELQELKEAREWEARNHDVISADGTKSHYTDDILRKETFPDKSYRKYNAQKELTEWKMSDGKTLTFENDFIKTETANGVKRTYEVNDAISESVTHQDKFGDAKTVKKGRVIQEEFENGTYKKYDSNNRTVEESFEDGTVYKYSYETGEQKVSEASFPDGSKKVYFEDGAKVKVETLSTEAQNKTGVKTIEYDTNGNTVKKTFTDEHWEKYDINANNRISEMYDPKKDLVLSYEYNEDGTYQRFKDVGNFKHLLDEKTFPDGTKESYTYHVKTGTLATKTLQNGNVQEFDMNSGDLTATRISDGHGHYRKVSPEGKLIEDGFEEGYLDKLQSEYEANAQQIKQNCEQAKNRAYEECEEIRHKAYEECEKIRDKAYEECEKIRDKAYGEWDAAQNEAYKECELTLNDAYSKYQNGTITYEEYSEIRDEANNKKQKIYDEIESKKRGIYDEAEAKKQRIYNEIDAKKQKIYDEAEAKKQQAYKDAEALRDNEMQKLKDEYSIH